MIKGVGETCWPLRVMAMAVLDYCDHWKLPFKIKHHSLGYLEIDTHGWTTTHMFKARHQLCEDFKEFKKLEYELVTVSEDEMTIRILVNHDIKKNKFVKERQYE